MIYTAVDKWGHNLARFSGVSYHAVLNLCHSEKRLKGRVVCLHAEFEMLHAPERIEYLKPERTLKSDMQFLRVLKDLKSEDFS